MDSADRDADPLSLDLRKVVRPCPLCRADIEVWEQLGPQAVVCGSCSLSCTIDATPPPIALGTPLLEPIVDVSSEVEHWLEHAPKPIHPELTPEGRRARKRRRIAAAAGGCIVLAMALVAGRLGYVAADQEFARRLAEERALAHENELHLLSVKQRLERARLDAEQRKAAAERDARLMTARYLAAQAQKVSAASRWAGVSTAVKAVDATLIQDGYAVPEAHQSLRDAVARIPNVYDVGGPVLRGHGGEILALAASRDGRWLATGSADHAVRLWDMHGGDRPRSTALHKHDAAVSHVLFSHDSRWLVTGSSDSTACIWDLAAERGSRGPVMLPGCDSPITGLAMSPNGRWLAIIFAGMNGGAETARLWDLSEGPQEARSLELNGQNGRIQSLAISPDSRWLAISVDDTVHMWDLAAHVPAIASVGRQCRHGGVTSTLFTGDGKWLVTSGRDGAAKLWNLVAGDPSNSLQLGGHRAPVHLLAASADSRWLATGSDRVVRIWDLSAKPTSASGFDLPITGTPLKMTFSDDGRWLAVAASDGNIHLWAFGERGPAEDAVKLRAGRSAGKLAFTSDNRWLAATVEGQSVRLWNMDVHDLKTRAEDAWLAQMRSIAYRYLWLDPTQTIVGSVACQQLAATNYCLAWRSLESPRARFLGKADELVAIATLRWREIRPKVVHRIAARRTTFDVPVAEPAASTSQPSADDSPSTAETRYVTPRHATQGNTLRLYVR